MLRKTITSLALLVSIGIVAALAAPAKATMIVTFHADSLCLDYDVEAKNGNPANYMLIQSTVSTILTVCTADDSDPTDVLDTAILKTVDPGFTMSDEMALTLTWSNASGDWVGTGTATVKELDGDVKMMADVTTTSASFAPLGVFGFFQVAGNLTPYDTNTSVLLPTVHGPWSYVGNSEDGTEPNADGETNQVTVSPADAYGTGTLFDFSVSQTFTGGNLDEFLSNDQFVATAGDAIFTVIPAPAAVVLGMIGLFVIGVRMRRHA